MLKKREHPMDRKPTPSAADPVAGERAAGLQEQAERLAATLRQAGETGTDTRHAESRQQRLAQDMAALRHEALQARRLAGRVHARPADNRGGDGLSFNPLHPSSELPPEQLIRLLSLRSRKPRRKTGSCTGPTPAADSPQTDAPAARATPIAAGGRTRSQPPATTAGADDANASIDARPAPGGTGRLLATAVGVGAVLGLALSFYLFWE